MLPARLLMIHDPRRGRQHYVTELSRGKQLDDPFLEIGDAHVVSGGDDACFVYAGGALVIV